MLTTPTMEKLKEMKFYGMLKGLEEQLASNKYQSLCFEKRLALLVDREASERQDRQFQSRIRQASLRQQACIEDIDYSLSRGLDKYFKKSLLCIFF